MEVHWPHGLSALISGLRSPALSTGWGHCVDTFLSQCFSPHPGVQSNGYQQNFNARGNPVMD